MTRILNLATYAVAAALALATALVTAPANAVAHTPRHARVSAHVDVSGQALYMRVQAVGGSRCAPKARVAPAVLRRSNHWCARQAASPLNPIVSVIFPPCDHWRLTP